MGRKKETSSSKSDTLQISKEFKLVIGAMELYLRAIPLGGPSGLLIGHFILNIPAKPVETGTEKEEEHGDPVEAIYPNIA